MRLRLPAFLLSGVLLLSCTKSDEPAQPAAAVPYRHQATMAQLMNWVFDVQADIVWAVGETIISEEGETRIVPKNDDEWNAVRNAAATVAEASNLLMMEGRARDNGDWLKFSRMVLDKANECVAAAEAKDLDALFTAAGDMYLACTSCHAKYVIGQPLSPEDMPK
jgi:hypothetical protein